VTAIAAAVKERDSIAREMAANIEIATQSVTAIDNSANLIASATEGAETSVRDAAKQLVA
jgi:hypothetical protein